MFVEMLAGIVAIFEPANAMPTGWEFAKPVPLMFMEDPMGPLVGLKVIEGTTVKLAYG